MSGVGLFDLRTIWLCLVLEQFGMVKPFEDFVDRLERQKVVYLVQKAAGRTKYHFNRYVHGPYSPGLAAELYRLNSPGQLEALQEEAAFYRLGGEMHDAVGAGRMIVNPPDGVERPKWLELLTSMIEESQKFGEYGFDDLWKAVDAWKPGVFENQTAIGAWDRLSEYGLLAGTR